MSSGAEWLGGSAYPFKGRRRGMELSKRRIRRTARRLGMATVNELEKRRRDSDAS